MPNTYRMKFGFRLRFALWLLAALLPVGIAAFYVFDRMQADISERVTADLEGVLGLEAFYIQSALELYRDHGRTLASGAQVIDMTADVVNARDQLGPIVDLVKAHKGFGATSETHIAQRRPDGDVELITELRFDRDAAFNQVLAGDAERPINQPLA